MKATKVDPSSQTRVVPQPGNRVTLTHSRSVKLSKAWNSADLHFGMSMECANTPEDIARTYAAMEETIEQQLAAKMKDQFKLLDMLATRQGNT